MGQETILGLTDGEKEEILSSIYFLRDNLEILIKKFYSFLLHTRVGDLFKTTNMEKQYQMFHASIGVIIAHIEHPLLLQGHLDTLISKHVNYGVLSEHIDYFSESFLQALKGIFDEKKDKRIIELWYKLIMSVMNYFKSKLP
jgi:hemoglobin-like flavoprotein